MRLVVSIFALGVALVLAQPAQAAPINVALNKTVTATGAVGVITCCWSDSSVYPPAPLSSLTDGVFLQDGTEWQDGTIWWDERYQGSVGNAFTIDLAGTYLISTISLQADNNDEYWIETRNFAGNWITLGYWPPCCGAGLATRSVDLGSFESTAFRIHAQAGDQWYAVSEFQAVGTAVPEPASLVLLGTGVAALVRRRFVSRRA